MVNFNLSNTVLNSEVFIIGLPEHINQLGYISYNNEDITKQIDTYRHHHLISSQLGKISSTLLPFKRLVKTTYYCWIRKFKDA